MLLLWLVVLGFNIASSLFLCCILFSLLCYMRPSFICCFVFCGRGGTEIGTFLDGYHGHGWIYRHSAASTTPRPVELWIIATRVLYAVGSGRGDGVARRPRPWPRCPLLSPVQWQARLSPPPCPSDAGRAKTITRQQYLYNLQLASVGILIEVSVAYL
ncbi:hypothetical protein B0H10DRAFT_2089882 [Mycena sp. CBHHK59/15]|nr:hypothetical protein B0H10DRAFT_2089882 [Mycena sp. CBHHK59/15]